jgi:GT2 family glycosyltransferase
LRRNGTTYRTRRPGLGGLLLTRGIHVIVVAYHAPETLERCLMPLAGVVGTTVVDNSSSVAVKRVAAACGAAYIDPQRNLGFAAGVNLALRKLIEPDAVPQDILLLNPDAELTANQLTELAAFLHREGRGSRCAAVAPRLIDDDGQPQRVLWPFPSPLRAWIEAFGLGRLPARQTFAIGAVLLLRWEAVRDVGLFDERFFLYAEEVDWQRRALKQRWVTQLCPNVLASHMGAGTSPDPSRREVLFYAAHEIYLRRWYGQPGWSVYRAAAIVGSVTRAMLLRGERRKAAQQRVLLFARGPRRSAASLLSS